MRLSCIAALACCAPLAAQSPADRILAVHAKRMEILRSEAIRGKSGFLPLPVGAVVPEGWLRDWALTAASGITGHLDEYAATFREAWEGFGFDARGANPDGTGWPLEQSSYWLDGAVRLAYILDDQALIAKVKARLDAVVAGVLSGGESFIYWRPRSVLSDSFNSWAHSHMGRALVAYYQATGDERVLKALIRVYTHFPVPALRSDFQEVCGAVNVDAMLETYLMSGNADVLRNLAAFSAAPSFAATADRWLAGNIQPGHNVIFYEDIRVPAIVYAVTGNPRDLETTARALAWHDRNHLLPYGMSSGEEYHAGIGATRNTETCNLAASMWTYLWMLRATGNGEYSDRIERVFLNAAAAPVSRDFRTMCYYQSPNRYSASLPAEEPHNPGPGSYQFTPLGHSVLCCVGNLNRVIPNYIEHMWMATADDGIAATLYGPSRVRAVVGDGVKVEISAVTNYPFEETIRLNIRLEKPAAFPLYLRIPSWCAAPRIRINGRLEHGDTPTKGFLRVLRTWSPDDRVELRLPMSVKVVRGRETPYPEITYFASSRQLARDRSIDNPFASVYYGPLLFALPIVDETPNRDAAGSRFNYALRVKGPATEAQIAVLRHPMPARWDWPLAAPLELSLKAVEFDWKPTELQPLPKQPITDGRPTDVKLVPYGCTKFRVSMFPVSAQ
ncbi:MAG: beta-L-arabinofuranosidase domain-containing protein [Bryobacteraceae bacterium]|jgi:hypothetical protein